MFAMRPTKQSPWRTPSAFAESHCMKCAAGWTRRSKNGSYLVVCLLDRDPVLAETVSCDRYEPKDEPV